MKTLSARTNLTSFSTYCSPLFLSSVCAQLDTIKLLISLGRPPLRRRAVRAAAAARRGGGAGRREVPVQKEILRRRHAVSAPQEEENTQPQEEEAEGHKAGLGWGPWD